MLLWATFDQNSVIVRLKLLDSAVSTGAGKTGLSSASSGLIISTIADSEATPTVYTQAGSTIETITTLATYAAPTATKCRFKEVDATNHKGIYELQFADARFSIASAKSLLISISGVTGVAEGDAVIPLPVIDLFASAVPATVAGAVGSVTGNVGGNVTGTVASVTADVGITQAGADKVWSTTTRALTDKIGFALSAAGIQAIWDALTSALTTVGSIGKLLVDNVNATISSRSTYAGADTAGTTTLLSRLASALTITGGKVDVNDKTGFELVAAYDPAKTAAQAGDAMALTSGERTTLTGVVWANATRTLTSFGTLVADVATAVWGAATRTLTAFGFSVTVGTNSDKTGYALTSGEEDAIVDKVWDETLASHLAAGSTGEALDAATSGGAPTAADNADAVWDEARAGHVGAGSFGEGLASVQGNVTGSVASVTADVGITQGAADKVWLTTVRTLSSFGTLVADVATAVWGATTRLVTAGTNIVLAKGVGVTGFNDLSAAQVNAEADTALADAGVTTTVTGRIDAAVSTRLATAGYTVPPTVGAVADGVWDEALAGHLTAGSTGEALGAAGSAGDPWLTALPGAYGAGTAGEIVGSRIPLIDDKLGPITGSGDNNVLGLFRSVMRSDMFPVSSDVGGTYDSGSSLESISATVNAIPIPDPPLTAQQTRDAMEISASGGELAISVQIADVKDRVVALATRELPMSRGLPFDAFEFVMYDAADHISPMPGLTVTAERCLDGAAFEPCDNAPTEVSNGAYKIDLTGNDNDAKALMLRLTAPGADDMLVTILTVPPLI